MHRAPTVLVIFTVHRPGHLYDCTDEKGDGHAGDRPQVKRCELDELDGEDEGASDAP